MTRDVLLREALQLSNQDRADVAAELLASLDDDSPGDRTEIEKAWAGEIERRGRRVLAEGSVGKPWGEVRERIQSPLSKTSS